MVLAITPFRPSFTGRQFSFKYWFVLSSERIIKLIRTRQRNSPKEVINGLANNCRLIAVVMIALIASRTTSVEISNFIELNDH